MAMEYFDWSEKQANIRPNKVAIINLATEGRLTYGELNERSSSLGAYLQEARRGRRRTGRHSGA